MRRLVYFVATTIDGFVAGPDGGDPTGAAFFASEPDLIAFIAEHYPETLPGPARQAMGIEGPNKTFDTALEGRSSYQVGLDAGVADAYPHLRHLVFSSTLSEPADPAIELVASDPLAVARKLKSEDGLDIWIVGGGTLAHALLPEIDRIVIKQHPSVIGSGVPMFQGPFQPQLFAAAETRQLPSGIRVLHFDRQ